MLRNPATQVADVEAGRFDWMENPPPPDQYAAVKDKYEGTQFREEQTESTYFFWMNVTEPPFDDVAVRRAVNYAVDPRALERIYAGQLVGTQQILPPGMPGYERYELYPHDLQKAKQMIDEADPADRQITVWTDNERTQEEAGTYYAAVLEEIGFEVKLQVLNADNYFTVIGNASTPNLDTGWASWFQDYPHPNDFFQPHALRREHLPDQHLEPLADRRPGAEREDRPASPNSRSTPGWKPNTRTSIRNSCDWRRGPPTAPARSRPSSPRQSTSTRSSTTPPSTRT